MKIGILGGAFDPPHFGHFLIAIQTTEIMSFDEVVFMPCFSHPFQKDMVSSSHRLEMTKILIENDFSVSDSEIKKNNISYSIDTLDYFAKLYPQNQYFFIIGSDQIEFFPRWKNWKKIITEYKLVIFPRSTDNLKIKRKIIDVFKNELSKKIHLIENKEAVISNLSSSIIRKRVLLGKSIKGLVPEKLEEYIKINKLYVTDNSRHFA